MFDTAIDMLRRAHGWTSLTRPTLLHHGENQMIGFTADGQRFAARICRAGADAALLKSESAWLEALAPRIAVPHVVTNESGSAVSTVEIESGERLAMVFTFIDGTGPDDRDPSSYRLLGETMMCLHDAADEILSGRPSGWLGRARPDCAPPGIVDGIDQALRSCDLADGDIRRGYLRIGDRALRLAGDLDLASGLFVHADLHTGNTLVTESGLVCFDFEECGFGPRVIDPGVVRFHVAARGLSAECWDAFLEGYGPHDWTPRELALGAVLRILYAASKVPERLDVPDIAGRAPAILRRYLSLCETLLEDL